MSSCRSMARVVAPGSVSALAPLPSARKGSLEATAYQAGVQAGLEQATAGPAAALERARRRLEQAAVALECAVGELRSAREAELGLEVADAAALALELLEAMVGHAPESLSPALVASALALAPDDEMAVVRVHPEDSAAIAEGSTSAKVVSDPGVERGGCVVEVGATRIDAQRSRALSRLRRVLQEA